MIEVEQKIASVCDAIVQHETATRAELRSIWTAHQAMVRNQANGLEQPDLDAIIQQCGSICLDDLNVIADVRDGREDAAMEQAYNDAVAKVKELVARGDLLGAIRGHGPLIASVSATVDPATGAIVVDCPKSELAKVVRTKVVRSRESRGTSSGSPKGAPDMRPPKEVVYSMGTPEDRAAYEAASKLTDASTGLVKNRAATAKRALADAILAREPSAS